MPVFRAEVAWRVAVDILCVDVGSVLDQSLDDAEVASEACDVQRRAEVVRSGVDLGSELDEYLDERRVAFARRQVERSEAIRICAIDDFVHFVFLVEILLGECEDLDDLSPVTLVHLGPVVHLDFFYVLLSITLCLRLLALA